MKLLLVIPYIPNFIRIRPFNFVRFLARAGHEVHLATLWQDQAELDSLEPLKPALASLISERLTRSRTLLNAAACLPTSIPLQAVYSWEPRLLAKIQSFLENNPDLDAVHVEHLRGSMYATAIQKQLLHAGKPTPLIWDSVDCISYLFEQAGKTDRSLKRRLINLLELERTRTHETRMVRLFDQVLVTSVKDHDALRQLHQTYPPSKVPSLEPSIHLLPNGVDTEFFSPGEKPKDPNTIVFSGKISYHANIDAVEYLVREIMPAIWAQRPETVLQVVGKDPPAGILAFADQYPGRVVVTGTVPELAPWLQAAAVAVVPIRYGAGIQNKVLEAMACGTAVISSPVGVSALNCTDDQELLVRDDSAGFAAAILDLLSDRQRQARIAQAGRKYVETHFAWPQLIEKLTAIYSLSPRTPELP